MSTSNLVRKLAPDLYSKYLEIKRLEEEYRKSLHDISSDWVRKMKDPNTNLSQAGKDRFVQEITKVQDLEKIKAQILEKVMPRKWKMKHGWSMSRGTIESNLKQYTPEPEHLKLDPNTNLSKVDNFVLSRLPSKWHDDYKLIIKMENKNLEPFHKIYDRETSNFSHIKSASSRYKQGFRTKYNIVRGIYPDPEEVKRLDSLIPEAKKKRDAFYHLFLRHTDILSFFIKNTNDRNSAKNYMTLREALTPFYSQHISAVDRRNRESEERKKAEKEKARLQKIQDEKKRKEEEAEARKIKIEKQTLEIQRLQLESLRAKKPVSVFVEEKEIDIIPVNKEIDVSPVKENDITTPIALGGVGLIALGGLGLLLMRGKK